MAVLETLVRHASDWLDWIDRSGFAAPEHQPRVAEPLAVTLSQAPTDLRLYPKRGQTVFWRQRPPGLQQTLPGQATPEGLARPAEPPYPVAGEVSDPAGRFNPRRFAISAGNAAGHALDLYRSPKGTRLGSGGAIRGHIRLAGGGAVPWALVRLVVTLPPDLSVTFVAQADAHGDFVLPLDRIPALTKDALSPTLQATLSIRMDPAATPDQAPDPDAFTARDLHPPGAGAAAATAALAVTPGAFALVTSQGRDHLALVAPP